MRTAIQKKTRPRTEGPEERVNFYTQTRELRAKLGEINPYTLADSRTLDVLQPLDALATDLVAAIQS